MTTQLKLEFEPGLAQRYRDMRDCFGTCVYRAGLSKVAAVCDVAPSNLSSMLSGERNLDPKIIETYMREFSDPTPALYWAARWCQDAGQQQAQALAQLPGMLAQMQAMLEQFGGGQGSR